MHFMDLYGLLWTPLYGPPIVLLWTLNNQFLRKHFFFLGSCDHVLQSLSGSGHVHGVRQVSPLQNWITLSLLLQHLVRLVAHDACCACVCSCGCVCVVCVCCVCCVCVVCVCVRNMNLHKRNNHQNRCRCVPNIGWHAHNNTNRT